MKSNNNITKEEIKKAAREFDSKLKKHPMSSEELQKVLSDFGEILLSKLN